MIIDEKTIAPPPYCSTRRSISSSSSPNSLHPYAYSYSYNPEASLRGLPSHLLLNILHWTCPPSLSNESRRIVLYWMATSLRYTCRSVWIACMHILRSTYLPLYKQHILPPFTSDPFPSSIPALPPPSLSSRSLVLSSSPGAPPSGSGGGSAAHTHHHSSSSHSSLPRTSTNVQPTALDSSQSIIPSSRETAVLDLFIVIRVRADVRSDESDLYLDNEDERYRDMFNYTQPRARLEDLICKYALRYDLISISSPGCASPSSSAYPSPTPSYTTIPQPPPPSLLRAHSSTNPYSSSSPNASNAPNAPNAANSTSTSNPNPNPNSIARPKPPFADLAITWGNRQISLTLRDPLVGGRRKVIVEVGRERGESLESLARRIVGEWVGMVRGGYGVGAAGAGAGTRSNGNGNGGGTRGERGGNGNTVRREEGTVVPVKAPKKSSGFWRW